MNAHFDPASAIWGMQVRDGGVVAVLRGFFDETITHSETRLTGVAGCIFDDVGYQAFRSEWGGRTKGLKKPFHMTACYGGYGEFGAPPWSSDARDLLCRQLGELTARTRLAGFVCYMHNSDYEKYIRENPSHADIVGDCYSLCLLFCVELMADYAKKKKQDVYYTFESGHAREKQAQAMLRRANANSKVREMLNIGGYAFVSKANEPTLCSADFLAWTCQRSLAPEGNKEWHPLFEIVRTKSRGQPLYITRLSAGNVMHQAIFNTFYGLHSDDALARAAR